MLTKVLPNWLDKATLNSFADPRSTEHFQAMSALRLFREDAGNQASVPYLRSKCVNFILDKLKVEDVTWYSVHDFAFSGIRRVLEGYFNSETLNMRSVDNAQEALINPLSNALLWVNSLPDVE